MPRLEARVVGHSSPFAQLEFTGQLGAQRIEVPRRTTLTFRSVDARALDVSNQAIDNYGAYGSRFEDCDFSRTVFGGGVFGHLPQVTYLRCRFDDADLRKASPLWARFEACQFTNSRLDEWNATDAEFVDCSFTGRLLRVKFSARPWRAPGARKKPPRTSNAFSGNDFSDAELIDCSFSGGLRLSANQWPSGPGYLFITQAQQRLRSVRSQVETWPETPARKRALIWLDVHSKWGYDEQEELILRRDEIAPGLDELLVTPDE
jgi:uncharacterized protein YjbI with pentapeptide repeats